MKKKNEEKTQKEKKKMGRPEIQIDKEQFEKLCGLQCTRIEIAGFFKCSEDTIERWCKKTYNENFAVVFAQKRVTGLISLRRTQFKLAEKSAALSIFLGKNYLGQKDVIEEVDNDSVPDDGFMDAIKGSAASDWSNEDGENQNE